MNRFAPISNNTHNREEFNLEIKKIIEYFNKNSDHLIVQNFILNKVSEISSSLKKDYDMGVFSVRRVVNFLEDYVKGRTIDELRNVSGFRSLEDSFFRFENLKEEVDASQDMVHACLTQNDYTQLDLKAAVDYLSSLQGLDDMLLEDVKFEMNTILSFIADFGTFYAGVDELNSRMNNILCSFAQGDKIISLTRGISKITNNIYHINEDIKTIQSSISNLNNTYNNPLFLREGEERLSCEDYTSKLDSLSGMLEIKEKEKNNIMLMFKYSNNNKEFNNLLKMLQNHLMTDLVGAINHLITDTVKTGKKVLFLSDENSRNYALINIKFESITARSSIKDIDFFMDLSIKSQKIINQKYLMLEKVLGRRVNEEFSIFNEKKSFGRLYDLINNHVHASENELVKKDEMRDTMMRGINAVVCIFYEKEFNLIDSFIRNINTFSFLISEKMLKPEESEILKKYYNINSISDLSTQSLEEITSTVTDVSVLRAVQKLLKSRPLNKIDLTDENVNSALHCIDDDIEEFITVQELKKKVLSLGQLLEGVDSVIVRKIAALEDLRKIDTILEDISSWYNQYGILLSVKSKSTREKVEKVISEAETSIMELKEYIISLPESVFCGLQNFPYEN